MCRNSEAYRPNKDPTKKMDVGINDLTMLCVSVFHGDRFFQTFKKMHDAALEQHSDVTTFLYNHPQLPTRQEIHMVLRLWAGDISRPKKRKVSSTTQYDRAKGLIENPVTLYACRLLCLERSWDSVMYECDSRLERAESSHHWDEEGRQRRIDVWESRYDAMSSCDDSLFAFADSILKGDIDAFVVANNEGFPELDCM